MRASIWLPLVPLALLGMAQAPPAPAPGTSFNVELQHKLDSKKAKPGDPVVATLKQDVKAGGRVVIPKNSLLVGTVTTVSASENHSPGKIGVLFDRATDKKGAVLAHLRAAIVQVAVASGDEYGMLTRPAEMGGTGAPPPMAGGNGGGANRDTNGVPLQIAVMETFNGAGADLGGILSAASSNFSLDDGTVLKVRVLH